MAFSKVVYSEINGQKWIGGLLEFFVIFDTADVTPRITVKDPANNKKVDAVNMTEEADRVFSYVWQSTESTDIIGRYEVFIEGVSGSDISLYKEEFVMEDPELDD